MSMPRVTTGDRARGGGNYRGLCRDQREAAADCGAKEGVLRRFLWLGWGDRVTEGCCGRPWAAPVTVPEHPCSDRPKGVRDSLEGAALRGRFSSRFGVPISLTELRGNGSGRLGLQTDANKSGARCEMPPQMNRHHAATAGVLQWDIPSAPQRGTGVRWKAGYACWASPRWAGCVLDLSPVEAHRGPIPGQCTDMGTVYPGGPGTASGAGGGR